MFANLDAGRESVFSVTPLSLFPSITKALSLVNRIKIFPEERGGGQELSVIQHSGFRARISAIDVWRGRGGGGGMEN